ncbi:MAG TPA: aspartate carbamoyltransferase regulatory subunit [Spirochaetota bacterium]|nr:aspartate carbamoyltransferase regulatory subunit [Spirochaetota bacterium]HPP04452.1 aspartate carbamoyltransferase regulatory subunit [Spirochaetota bacterium]
MSEERSYKVFKIENGTVIDHITSPMALKIIEVLGIKEQGIISMGMNFSSSKTGKKDLIKIENVYLSKSQTDIIALFSPNATINIIKDGKVVEKRKIEIPEIIHAILKCPNPTCVTNNYRDCESKFVVERHNGKSTIVRCFYCERETIVTPDMIK